MCSDSYNDILPRKRGRPRKVLEPASEDVLLKENRCEYLGYCLFNKVYDLCCMLIVLSFSYLGTSDFAVVCLHVTIYFAVVCLHIITCLHSMCCRINTMMSMEIYHEKGEDQEKILL